jgi:hypothetical protein
LVKRAVVAYSRRPFLFLADHSDVGPWLP